jgi:polar amino acid transport system substrate-binding protein
VEGGACVRVYTARYEGSAESRSHRQTIQGECMIARHLKSLSASVGKPRRSWVAGSGIVALAALLLAGCGSTATTSASGTPNARAGATSTVTCNASATSAQDSWHLVTPNVLTIASDTTYAPAEYADPQNPSHFIGYDMDLIREIARRMCLVPNIQQATFSNIIDLLSGPALGQQRYDISISSFTINSDRLQKVDFVPYFIAGESTLVKKGNPSHISQVSDLCGKTVAAQNATIELAELEALNGQNVSAGDQGVPQQPVCKSNLIKILSFDSEEVVVQQVIDGRADATYQDQPVTDYYIGLHTSDLDHGFITANSQGTEGIAVRKDNAAFESAVKTALNNMVADGTYTRIMAAWGQTALACLIATNGCPPAS